MLVPHFAVCYTTPRRSRPKHHRPDLFAPRYASMPASCSASNSIAPRAASASPGTASAPSFMVLPTSSELCPRAYVRESNSCDKRRGLLVLPSASCSATLQRSRPKPQQPDLFVRATPACCTFASLKLRILLATLREQLAQVSVPSQHLFLVLPTSSELCPRAGILESRRDNRRPRKPVFPFCRGSHRTSC